MVAHSGLWSFEMNKQHHSTQPRAFPKDMGMWPRGTDGTWGTQGCSLSSLSLPVAPSLMENLHLSLGRRAMAGGQHSLSQRLAQVTCKARGQ